MQLNQLLDILGIPETEIPVAKTNEVNLYIHPGKDPAAKLFSKDGKFTVRFGDAVYPTSNFEITDEGVRRFSPIKAAALQARH